MGSNSKIEWTRHTFNAWVGCSKVSAGCTRCYAESLAKRTGLAIWGDSGTRHVTSDAYWQEPYKWATAAGRLGERHRVFCNSLADVFEDRPDLSAPRHRLWKLILDTRHSLDWLLLTKRPEHFDMLPLSLADSIWLGVSCENQATADERIPLLLQAPAAVRFVSVEPMLGAIDLSRFLLYNPINEETTGRGGLPGRSGGRTGDRRRGPYLESEEARVGPLETLCGKPGLYESEGRERQRGLPPSERDVQREGLRDRGASSCLQALQGTNPRGPDGEPPRWGQEAESPGQSGVSNLFRSANSRDSCFESGPCLQPVWNQELNGETLRRSDSSDSGEIRAGGRDADQTGESLRSGIPNDIRHREGWGEKVSSGADGGLCKPKEQSAALAKRAGPISLIIVGGESGPGARPMDENWVRSIRDQCVAASTSFFYKQRLENGHKISLPLLDGQQWAQFPEAPDAK